MWRPRSMAAAVAGTFTGWTLITNVCFNLELLLTTTTVANTATTKTNAPTVHPRILRSFRMAPDFRRNLDVGGKFFRFPRDATRGFLSGSTDRSSVTGPSSPLHVSRPRNRPSSHLRDHFASGCGQDDVDRKVPPLRQRHPP